MAGHERNGFRGFLFSRSGLVAVGFLAVAGYFLWTEHEAHARAILPYLPFLLLLACALMYLFMHHGHGSRGGHGHRPGSRPEDGAARTADRDDEGAG